MKSKNQLCKQLIVWFLLFLCFFNPGCSAQLLTASSSDSQFQNSKVVGELFGVPVPIDNYYFAWGVIQVFGTRWRGVPKTPGETEEQVWMELLLSYEAFTRDIKVSREEVEEEIAKILSSNKVAFNWKESPQDYTKWLKENTGEPVQLFENQVEHLIKVEKLRKQVIDSINPEVSEEEAIQEFRNEHNTLSVELIQFDDLDKAQEYYNKVKQNPGFWDEEKQKNPDSFRRPGFVALEFLMDMWKFHKEDVYKMLELKTGDIYPPAPIYKGYGVFKILEIRRAKDEDFPQYRDSYYEQVKMHKKYEGFQQWLKDLRERANIKVYMSSTEIFSEGK